MLQWRDVYVLLRVAAGWHAWGIVLLPARAVLLLFPRTRREGSAMLLRAAPTSREKSREVAPRRSYTPVVTETAAMDVKAIWRELHDKLQGFIARRIANPDDAEDILQEVFLRVHSRIATLSDAERVNGWVYQIARNTIIDHYRSNGHKTDILTERDESEWTVADDDSDTERLRRGLAASLVRMVSRLPEPYAEAIRLTELDGLTQKAAAERVGISLSGMKSRVQRGREKLKQMLLECCHFAFDSRGAVVGAYERNESCACCEREGECGCE